MTLDSKGFMITGAARGIGAATAELLIKQSHRVALCDVDRTALLATCKRLGPKAFPVDLDVRQPEYWESALGEAYDRLGRVDVLVNNAGVNHVGRAHELPLDEVDHIIDVNLRGPILGMRAIVPRFLRDGGGHIINIASGAAFFPAPGFATYSATKHGLRAMTNAMRLELRDALIAFTMLYPGPVETPMLQATTGHELAAIGFGQRVATPERIAEAVATAAEERPYEIFIPNATGRITRWIGTLPSALERVVPFIEKRGRRAQARRRKR